MTTLAVVASGLVTGLGFNAPATLAALRAGLSAVRETPWKDHGSGDPIKGSRVSLPHWWEGTGKLADLVAPAGRPGLQRVLREQAVHAGDHHPRHLGTRQQGPRLHERLRAAGLVGCEQP